MVFLPEKHDVYKHILNYQELLRHRHIHLPTQIFLFLCSVSTITMATVSTTIEKHYTQKMKNKFNSHVKIPIILKLCTGMFPVQIPRVSVCA